MKTKLVYGSLRITIACLFTLTSCSALQTIPPQRTSPIPLTATIPVLPATSTQENHTPTSVPTAISTPHPLSIVVMRAKKYPGSELTIVEELLPGANYKRFIASYFSEGQNIRGLLTIPNGEKPAEGWPVIIFNHGYIPPKEYRTTERYVAYVDLFARNGYIVFKSDYRGHGESEGVARGAYGNPDFVVDVLNAVSAVKQFSEADAKRIGMWGHSMGGYITLRVMVITKDVKAGVIWGGVVASYPDLLTKWRRGTGAAPRPPQDSRTSWRSGFLETFGSPEENPKFWNSISANSYLADISGPLQLHHGTKDDEVPLEFSETLFYQMLEAEKNIELYKYNGDNHNISIYFNMAMQRSIEFFDKYVKN